jgi:pimeloyl-ACP methyl ester carboxylesterase
MKHQSIATPKSGINTLRRAGLAEGSTLTEHEAAQVERANASGATPVVFVHGLWLLPSSWDRWVTLFEEAGFVSVTPGWPDDPETVAAAREHPEVLAGKGIGEIADYEEAIIRRLDRKPVVIGHSFGGLLTMILAGRGVAAASVAISPAPFRGVLPLPVAALARPAWPCATQPIGTVQSRSATSSSATASRTWSARTRPRSCTLAIPFPVPASRSSRQRPRT